MIRAHALGRLLLECTDGPINLAVACRINTVVGDRGDVRVNPEMDGSITLSARDSTGEFEYLEGEIADKILADLVVRNSSAQSQGGSL